ncbi:MAG: hypothetical protein ACI4R9_07235 [Kiritimatiellia bacterium]
MMVSFLFLAVSLVSPATLVDDDVLEPSVQNEVDHALDLVPTNLVAFTDYAADFRLFCQTNDVFGTNGLTRGEIAIKLISSQKRGGVWTMGTNDVTAVAVEILKRL